MDFDHPEPGINSDKSFLTCRTIKSTAVANGDSLDRAGANPAGFTLAVVDTQMILKFAGLIVGVAIIRERRAAPLNSVMK